MLKRALSARGNKQKGHFDFFEIAYIPKADNHLINCTIK